MNLFQTAGLHIDFIRVRDFDVFADLFDQVFDTSTS
jgi:hypothetical protein